MRRLVRVRPPDMSREPERVDVAVAVLRLKKVRLPSRVEQQRHSESGLMARQRMSDVRGRGSEVGVRAKMFQRRIVWSQEPEARLLPSGVNERVEMGPSWPDSWSRSWPVCTFQTYICGSSVEAAHTISAAGSIARQENEVRVGAVNVRKLRYRSMSQARTEPSREAVKRMLPLRE